MASANKILKGFSAFLDGYGYAGSVDSVQLPSLEVIKEDYRAGGMDGSIALDMGMSAMEADITLSSIDTSALSTWGLGEGFLVSLVIRGALESTDGETEGITAYLRGSIRSITFSEFTPGKPATIKIVMDVREYKYLQGIELVYDIDVVNSRRIINGVDALGWKNDLLGL